MKKIVCFWVLLMAASMAQSGIYKWTDSQGNVHFSDKPHRGAEVIQVPEAQTYSPPPVPETEKQNKAVAEDDETARGYEKIEIIQPENQATIRNNQGLVNVSVELAPDLKPGDRIQLIYDGEKLGPPQNTPNFILNNVYRGAHTIAVQVENAEGQVLTTSEPITIYMHRPRVGMVPQTRPAR
ncbi:DUF4124 domain-containing protein [Legionella israelensis]|uniref:DUF4124 domain-containing protein n=1 Tax=Legionella israelensis TaxID=454 RepID=A0A0W0VHX1_9GAMM|nr:DUF4124 domain-containing protein [Legionella israelensis]KTD19446.1 hypothetical protein Lisr_2008 [Legionella israelensis]QBR84135.1 DUF4124 domain-containing protein [Legionella israelensis]QBS08386.1 DUF4124 domain-containing protein [Legionella israelensis]QDP72761.1 DUF4124 domain-containing protein [Legionella israelensis]SCX92524.1 protein of unknown function [Legionella israelensis DSM 19235]